MKVPESLGIRTVYRNLSGDRAHHSNMIGVQIRENQELVVYPDPSSGVFRISGSGGFEFAVLNVPGKVVLSSESELIDLTNKPSGVYLLGFMQNGVWHGCKIMKDW